MSNLLPFIKEAQNFTETENGATALESTLNSCLDMFGSFGAMRGFDEDYVIRTFSKAFNESRETAMRMLFYFRDIRGGQGVRNEFRLVLAWLAENYPEYVLNNLDNIIFFGRGDDYLILLDTSLSKEVTGYLGEALRKDYENYLEGKEISLLAKWLPSENASSSKTKRYARKLITAFGFTPKKYRKMLSELRSYLKVVEVKMSANKWNEINYEAVPSRAAMNYSDAFFKHDEEGYTKYLEDIVTGSGKINAGTLFPVDIIHKCLAKTHTYTRKDAIVQDALWKSLPNYFEGIEESSICVVDTSGSMNGTPVEVALSLGMYCAERCNGPFKNHFFTFSSEPKLQEIIGSNIYEKLGNMNNGYWGMSTNLEATFDLILETAKENNCSQADLPSKLYIISDMQFDDAVNPSWCKKKQCFMQQMKTKFAQAGYVMPAIVYWNVRASKCGMFQDTFEGENCCMVSGYSPSLFEAIIKGTTYELDEVVEDDSDFSFDCLTQKIDPMTVMNTTISNERYDRVWVG